MADDPVTLSIEHRFTLANGCRMIVGTCTGPADYDATNGAACDLSDEFESDLYAVDFPGVDAKADCLVYPTYVNDDYTDLDGGAVYFTWGTAEDDEPFRNVADTTDLSGYVWRFIAYGI